MFEFTPIGYVRNSQSEMYQLPFQVGLLEGMTAVVELEEGSNYETALEDLVGVDRVWLIFVFHKALNWKPKITPPRGGQKRSVLATRSPHRPNPIGMSAVKLLGIDGRKLIIEDHDLLDGTPVLDIKPYLPYVDSYPDAASGWLDEVPKTEVHEVHWSSSAAVKSQWLIDNASLDLNSLVDVSLKLKPYPEKGNRIKNVEQGREIAVKTWRLLFTLEGKKVNIINIYSGYTEEYLTGEKQSRWGDVPLHNNFCKVFKD